MKRLISYVVLVVGLTLSVVAFRYTDHIIKEREHIRFETIAKEISIKVKGRMDAYRETLYAGVGLFEASASVEPEEWHRFVDTLKIDENFPGIQGLGYSQVIPYEHAKNPQPNQKLYTSIIYLEPSDWRNRRAFGYDMFSEKVRREAMLRAIYTGEPSASGKVRLVQENNVHDKPAF